MQKYNRVFFLGSGFSVDICPVLPNTDNMLEYFLNHLNHPFAEIESSILERFLKDFFAFSDNRFPRIEDALSFVDDCIQNNVVLQGKGRVYFLSVRDALKQLFFLSIKETIELTRPKITGEKVLKFVDTLRQGDVVLTTNYDLLLDNALYERKTSCKYGVRLRGSVEPILDTNGGRLGRYDISCLNAGNVPLFKLHGSLNWLYCPRCDELDLVLKRKIVAEKIKWRCVNSSCSSDYEPLIIMPSYYKDYGNRVFKEIWQLAEDALANAKEWIFIGYSLPDSDVRMRSILLAALARSSSIKISICDPDKKNEVQERYLRFLGSRGQQFFKCSFSDFLTKLKHV
jgi:hypothetical protein